MRFRFSVLLIIALFCSSVMAQKQTVPAKDDSESGWKLFSPDEGYFTVSLPGIPRADIAIVGTPFGPLKSHFFVLETDTFLFYISYVELRPGPQTPEENRAALDQSRDRALANHRLIKENEIMLDGIMGRELLVEKNDRILKGRIFYARQRLYHVIVIAPSNVVFRDGTPSPDAKAQTELFEKTSAKFLDSFKLTK